MRKEPRWLELSAILALHEEMLAEHGGSSGVRDLGLLESALARPRNLWEHRTPDLFDLAAAYAHGISRNHPFVDGNKRSAFLAAYTFLLRNSQNVDLAEADVVVFTVGLAEKSVSEERYAAWLRKCAAGRNAE